MTTNPNPDPVEIPQAEPTPQPARMPPDREVVAQIALDLARAESNPADSTLEAVSSDIETHGLSAYFSAAVQNMAAEEARAAQVARLPESFGVTEAPPFTVAPGGGLLRRTWLDCIGSRIVQPLRVFHPETLDEVKSVILQAEANHCRVKAVGSGHSFADVAGTRDFLVETHGLCRPLPIEEALLRPGSHPETLFATEAGIRVQDLNETLWSAGLGLENMGGYDGQTIAGVISTSTHGSGLAYGPLAAQAVSLTIVAAGGRVVRVEPTTGVTDPAAWSARHPEVDLKQDDDWFHAVQVGIGCMGILYSVILRVRPRYYLKEERTLSAWSQVRRDLQAGTVLRENDHYEVLVNPYPTRPDGDHACLITRRNPAPASSVVESGPLHTRNILVELAASVPGPSSILLSVLNAFPWFAPNVIDGAMQAIAGDYVDRSYRVYNIGMANEVPAYGSEIGFPLETCLDAIEQIFAISGRRQSLGQAYLTSPFSMRFVKASPAYLSMMHGTDTCMVEFISLDHTVGGKELLQEIETEMYAFGGRPHWGLLNFLTGAGSLLEAMYPLLPAWQQVRFALDPQGLFGNAFTERCGLTPHAFTRR
ncbi:MAG TPA: D-arabinono-1,4-lactone oxidase [Anaerolineaceae bacterium]|nr:D-arabinono-1,4-lactone oxidase [Anaerolineaceae bacterium]